MLKVSSLRHANLPNPSVLKQQVHQTDCNIQCDIQTQQLRKFTNQHQNASSKSPQAQTTTKKFKNDPMLKSSNRFYQTFNMKKINESEIQILKGLEKVALGKKIQPALSEFLRKQTVRFARKQESNQKLDMNIVTIFEYYLMFNQQSLKEIILRGNILNKIVKPFFAIFQSLKIDPGRVKICFSVDSKGNKIINKSQIYRIFKEFLPRQQLEQELQNLQMQNSVLYEQMYSKYEATPFYGGQPPEIEFNRQQGRFSPVNHRKKGKTNSPLAKKDPAILNKSRLADKYEKQNRELEQRLRDSNLSKQRPEQKVKRQLKFLSDSTSDMLKNYQN